MAQERCDNYLVCNQFINKNINESYCKDCLFYFNYTLVFKKNSKISIFSSIKNKLVSSSLLICPICLESPNLFIKQKSCEHFICSGCIYNIYFDKTYIRNMPINPIYEFKKSWDLYIYSNQSYKFRTKIINEFDYYTFDEILYNSLIQTYKYFIPSLFKKKLKELVYYQLEKNKYVTEYKDLQHKKINAIKKCPYCRKYEDEDEDEDDFVDSAVNNEDVCYRHTTTI